jgi:hypothetical protein
VKELVNENASRLFHAIYEDALCGAASRVAPVDVLGAHGCAMLRKFPFDMRAEPIYEPLSTTRRFAEPLENEPPVVQRYFRSGL